MENSFEKHWMERARFLTQALILSGTLNIGFLSTSIYFAVKEGSPVSENETASDVKKEFSNEEILRAYSRASFQELLHGLENKESVEEGCLGRDLALACLSAFHHFPVEKALGGVPLQKRLVRLPLRPSVEPPEMVLFAGLNDDHFGALLHFAKREKWPFTSKGLFLAISQSAFPYDPSLLDAFYCTPEFHSIHSLLQKYIPDLPKPLVVAMLKEGSWPLLERFSEKLRVLQLYSPEIYRECLVAYATGASSKIAADLLWRYELPYVLKRLSDEQILTFLDCHKEQKERAEFLAKELLLSLRSDFVRRNAAEVLYVQAGEALPDVFDYQAAVRRFCAPVAPGCLAVAEEPAPTEEKVESKYLIHTVQERDSLWKLSRRYKVSVETIMKVNSLENDRLRIGRELRIPSPEP